MKSEDNIITAFWYQPFDPSEPDVVVMNGVRKNPGSERSEAFDLLYKNQILLWDIKLLGVALLVSIFC